MIRAFIAVDLPEAVLKSLADLQRELKRTGAPLRWVRPESIHLTLRFLGDVFPERIPEIQHAIGEAASRARPFSLRPAGCGAFPSLRKMRVVWAGMEGGIAQLQDLQEDVERAMRELGFEPEDKPFRPHLTLGRVKTQGGMAPLREALVAREGFRAEAFDVTEVVLYKSELRPEGARYTALFRGLLGSRPQ